MSILGIETTGKYPSVALLKRDIKGEPKFDDIIEDETNYLEIIESKDEMNSLRDLTAILEEILNKTNQKMSDLKGVAVSVGAGSFTGIRIGVATARAIAQSLDIPCFSVETLKSFSFLTSDERVDLSCENFSKGQWKSPCMPEHLREEVWISTIINARRRQVYGGVFKIDAEKDIISGQCYLIEEYLELLKSKIEEYIKNKKAKANYPRLKVVFYGDGIDAYYEDIEEFSKLFFDGGINIVIADEKNRYQTARKVLLNGLKLFEKGESIGYEELTPNYMRKAEAEQKLDSEKKEILKKAEKDMVL